MRLDILCRTLAGNPCHLITITNNEVDQEAPLAEDLRVFRDASEFAPSKSTQHRKKASSNASAASGLASRGRSSIARQGKEPVVLAVHAEGNTTSLVSPDPYFGDLTKDSTALPAGSAASSSVQSPFAHLLRGANSFALNGVSTGKEVT